MEPTSSRQVYVRAGNRDQQNRPAKKERRERSIDPGEAICCLACGAVITVKEQKIQVGGAHSHTFFNPLGIVFEVGCFRQAPGCRAVGGPSAEFSWFPGYLWRVVLCHRCRIHLGWMFATDGDVFFGLILKNLLGV